MCIRDRDKDTNGNFEDPGVANVGNNFTYYPASSRVEINIAVTN